MKYFLTDSRIETSDTVSLEDFKRRLIVGNVQADQERAYACTVRLDNTLRVTHHVTLTEYNGV